MRAGALTLNGSKLLTFEHYVKRGDEVVLARLPGAQSAAAAVAWAAGINWRARVLHEDELLLVIDKPAGIASAPARAEAAHALGCCEAMLRARDGAAAPAELFPLHRLDKDTSGVLMLAKHARACEPVSRQFRTRGVTKQYWALLAGALPGPDEAQWADWLLLGTADGKAHLVPAEQAEAAGAKSAKTRVAVTERLGRAATVVSLAPTTGRMHQLRAQSAARGCAVLGDDRYGRATQGAATAPPRLCLHCARMTVHHPDDPATQLEFNAPLPEELAVYAQRLRKGAKLAAAAGAESPAGAQAALVAESR
jgi:RluA family pseudouridine synthase